MNRAIIVVLMLNLFIASCYAQERPNATQFKQGSEPNGFRGIEWNIDIDTIKEKKGLVFYGIQGLFETFIIQNDNMKIGDANLSILGYCFWKGRFAKIDIIVNNFLDYQKLKNHVFYTFGHAEKFDKDSYFWRGKKTLMFLRDFDKDKKIGLVSMSSAEIVHEIEQYMKKNSAKGSNSGF